MKHDENHKKINRAVQYDNLEATARYLEKMAREGWMLEKVSSATQFYFVKCEPKDLRFSVEIFAEGSEFDTHTIDSNLEFVEYCKKAGWNFICSAGKLDYFYTEDKNAPEIESDPEMKLKAIEKAQRFLKLYFPIYFILMGIAYMTMQFTTNLNATETSFFHFSGVMLWCFVGFIYLVNLIIYLVWRRKARNAVKNGERVPANKMNPSFRSIYAFLFLFAILHSVITVWVGLKYQENVVFLIPLIWIVVLSLIVLSYKLSSFAEKVKMGRGTYKVISMVVLPLCYTAVLTMVIIGIVFAVSGNGDTRRRIDAMDMKVFGDSEFFVRREGKNHHWGHFLLSFDQYTLEAHNADRAKMLDDAESQKTGVYQISDGEEHMPVTYTWSFDIYQTQISSIYDRILREAKAGKDYRMLSIRFDFNKAVRLPELEVDGITVWTYEETFEDDNSVIYRYLITDEDTIISARCDEALNSQEMQIIKTSFMD